MKNGILLTLTALTCACSHPSAVPPVLETKSAPAIVDAERQMETIVLKLPQDSPKWREVSWMLTAEDLTTERIPENQELTNWTDLIFIYFCSTVSNESISIDRILEKHHQAAIEHYPGKKISWNVIQKNRFDVMYEWTLHTQYKDIPPQHIISRVFLTKNGLNTIALNHRKMEMDQKEREKWIALLSKNITIENVKNVHGSDSTLSLLAQSGGIKEAQNSDHWPTEAFLLTAYNEIGNFKQIAGDSSKEFYHMVYIPADQEIENNTAAIEVHFQTTVTTDGHSVSIDELIEAFRSSLAKQYPQNSKTFNIIEKNQSDFIYEFNYPTTTNRQEFHAISHMFITEHGVYSISFSRNTELTDENERSQRLDILKNGIAFMRKADGPWLEREKDLPITPIDGDSTVL